MRTKGRIIREGKRENPGLSRKTREGIPSPVLIISKGKVVMLYSAAKSMYFCT